MKKNWLQFGTVCCLAASLTLGACNNTETDAKEVAEESNEAKFDTKAGENNAEFVVDAIAMNSAEVSLAQLALQRGSNQEIKDLAAMLEADHSALVTELKSLAATKAITVPAELSEDAKEKHQELSEVKAENFDKQWAKELSDKHEKTIKTYEDELKETTDPEIKSWVEATLPKIRAHHEKVAALHNKLK